MSKNAIVFGATSGIGRVLAKILVTKGYKVMITGRRFELLKEIESENSKNYIIRQHDIMDINSSKQLFEELPSIFNKIDLIVHSSGIGEANYNLDWELDERTLQTNVFGATKIYQLAYNYFKDQGYGHLVGITSVASIRGNRFAPAYNASKAFQSSYLESLWMKSKKTKKANITITNVLPGFVDTEIVKGKTFWMASVEKASTQIYRAIKNKKRKVYVTKRWWLVAIMFKIIPLRLLIKLI